MALARIQAEIDNNGKKEIYFLQTFEAKHGDEELKDPSVIPPGVVVKLTWTKIEDDARLIQEKHGNDFITRLPKSSNRTYSLATD